MTDEVCLERNTYYFMREYDDLSRPHRDNGPAIITIQNYDYDHNQPIVGIYMSIEEAEQQLANKTIIHQEWYQNGEEITDDVEEFLNNKDWPDDYRLWTKKHWSKFKLRF